MPFCSAVRTLAAFNVKFHSSCFGRGSAENSHLHGNFQSFCMYQQVCSCVSKPLVAAMRIDEPHWLSHEWSLDPSQSIMNPLLFLCTTSKIMRKCAFRSSHTSAGDSLWGFVCGRFSKRSNRYSSDGSTLVGSHSLAATATVLNWCTSKLVTHRHQRGHSNVLLTVVSSASVQLPS